MKSNTLHVVFGAGALGKELAGTLTSQGRRVRLVSRSGGTVAGAETVRADVTVAAEGRRAAAGAAVVYNCLNAPYHRWSRKLPPLFRGAIDAASAAGARLVVADNLYAYGLPPTTGFFSESQPLAPNSRKGRVRARMERELWEARRDGRLVGVSLLKAADFFGPDVEQSVLGGRVFRALAAGRPVDLTASPDTPHSFTFLLDMARAMAALGADAALDGRTWHAPTAFPALTTRDLLTLAAREMGRDTVRLRVALPWVLRALSPFVPMVRELAEVRYQFETPFFIHGDAFTRATGISATPLEQSLRITCRAATTAAPQTLPAATAV